MSPRLDLQLLCPKCGTIYLRIPDDVVGSTTIRCFVCGLELGTWQQLLTSFVDQGGQDGIFELKDGQFQRKA